MQVDIWVHGDEIEDFEAFWSPIIAWLLLLWIGSQLLLLIIGPWPAFNIDAAF